jgi:hypothetical protein
LITEREIVKLFSEQQEVELWKKKSVGELAGYLDKTIYHDELKGIKISEFGYSKVLRSGNLDVRSFLELTRQFIIGKESLLEEKFDFKELNISETISYKNFAAQNIVFAEGYLIKNNPYFSYLPFKPAKGEVLTIGSKNLNIGNSIINKNAFLMQSKNDSYKLGATYDWENLNETLSESAKDELKGRFKKMADADFTIVDHKAGVRPSVIDRRPVIGHHPKYKNLYIFNGLGTKGVMLAPYFAQKLINHFRLNEPLPAEVNVARFDKFCKLTF